MAWLDRFRRRPVEVQAQSPETPSSDLAHPERWLIDWAGQGSEQLFGGPVTERSAMQVSAVYRCVSLIAGAIASMDLGIYYDDPDKGRIASNDHRLFDLFNLAPFPGRAMSAYTFKELVAANILLEGNAYAAIRYDGAARVAGLEWAAPAWITITRKNFRSIYTIAWPDRSQETIDQDDMLHFVGPSWDGILGVSRIRFNARNSVALNKTLESATGVAHDNAVKPSVVFKLPQGVTGDAIKRMTAHFTTRFAGRSNVGRPLFLDAGTDFQPLTIPLTDLATIDALKFTVADISRFYGVPLSLLNENEGTTVWGSGVDSLIRGFLSFTLNADLHRIESEINFKLLGSVNYYAMFDRESLLQMDAVQTATANSMLINSGQITINEARQRAHRAKVPDGDEVLVNSTLVPLSRAVAPPPPPPAAPGSDPGDPAEPAEPAAPPSKDSSNAAS